MHLTRRNLFRLLSVSSSATVLYGCGGSSSVVPNGLITSVPRTHAGLEFTLSAPKSRYVLGENIPLTFRIKNVRPTPARLVSSGCVTLLEVTQNNLAVGPTTIGCGAGGVDVRNIQAGETVNIPDQWDQTNTLAQQVPSGLYVIKVWYNAISLDNSPPINREQRKEKFSASLVVLILTFRLILPSQNSNFGRFEIEIPY